MVDLLQQAKNVISGKSPNASPVVPADNRLDRIDQCKVIWYQWANELPTDTKIPFAVGFTNPLEVSTKDLSAAKSYDISNHIESMTFAKDKDSGAGSFSFTLHNSFDWDKYMRGGQWVAIFLSGSGLLPLPKEPQGDAQSLLPGTGKLLQALPAGAASVLGKLSKGLSPLPDLPLPKGPDASTFQSYKPMIRCLGVIQRVGVKSNTDGNGNIEESFVITGKDFGIVYEETELWFNANNAEAAEYEKLLNASSQEFVRNIGKLLEVWHDIFLNPAKAIAGAKANFKTFLPRQWLLPDRLVSDMGMAMDGVGYFGDLVNLKEFNATLFENPDPNPLSGLQGNAWSRLKSLSEPFFHELFTELSDSGNPKLIFRPTPWAQDTTAYPTLGAVMLKYSDLAKGQASPPLPVGTIGSDLKSLAKGALNAIAKKVSQSDIRDNHAVALVPQEVESYDLGPDTHSRYNFFLVDTMRHIWGQQNSFALVSKDIATPFPFRDENDIKRYGFKPLLATLQTFKINNSNLFGTNPDKQFMLEATEILRDFFANAEDFYSGNMLLAGGRSDVKLGKVVVTDSTFRRIPEMVLYIEGYTDSFVVNGDGVGTWTQSLNLARGVFKAVLDGGSSKDVPSTKTDTFHAFNTGQKKDDSVLGKVKSGIKDPKSLF